MPAVTKLELLTAALTAANKSSEILAKAKDYQIVASNFHMALNEERIKPDRDPQRILKLKLDRDWWLHKADNYHRLAHRYLRDSKRLTRKARWARD